VKTNLVEIEVPEVVEEANSASARVMLDGAAVFASLFTTIDISFPLWIDSIPRRWRIDSEMKVIRCMLFPRLQLGKMERSGVSSWRSLSLSRSS